MKECIHPKPDNAADNHVLEDGVFADGMDVDGEESTVVLDLEPPRSYFDFDAMAQADTIRWQIRPAPNRRMEDQSPGYYIDPQNPGRLVCVSVDPPESDKIIEEVPVKEQDVATPESVQFPPEAYTPPPRPRARIARFQLADKPSPSSGGWKHSMTPSGLKKFCKVAGFDSQEARKIVQRGSLNRGEVRRSLELFQLGHRPIPHFHRTSMKPKTILAHAERARAHCHSFGPSLAPGKPQQLAETSQRSHKISSVDIAAYDAMDALFTTNMSWAGCDPDEPLSIGIETGTSTSWVFKTRCKELVLPPEDVAKINAEWRRNPEYQPTKSLYDTKNWPAELASEQSGVNFSCEIEDKVQFKEIITYNDGSAAVLKPFQREVTFLDSAPDRPFTLPLKFHGAVAVNRILLSRSFNGLLALGPVLPHAQQDPGWTMTFLAQLFFAKKIKRPQFAIVIGDHTLLNSKLYLGILPQAVMRDYPNKSGLMFISGYGNKQPSSGNPRQPLTWSLYLDEVSLHKEGTTQAPKRVTLNPDHKGNHTIHFDTGTSHGLFSPRIMKILTKNKIVTELASGVYVNPRVASQYSLKFVLRSGGSDYQSSSRLWTFSFPCIRLTDPNLQCCSPTVVSGERVCPGFVRSVGHIPGFEMSEVNIWGHRLMVGMAIEHNISNPPSMTIYSQHPSE